ncbi:hypothetical protein QCA50_019701 [Cerrena zonata]|uniref:Uncharacterized protein n=1 Tax=Cerrena zonata TaxID=2478898 RepID=A0AAW0F8S3_9APHY
MKLWAAVDFVRGRTGLPHLAKVKLIEKCPEGYNIACLFYFANNLAPWAMERARDAAMIQKSKDAFDTDTEPK